ncbi:MAG TPA: dihydroneopterin triphosphate diphosphatase [Burkholderiales bacterium]|nr:dihydroneopterin triphosphate diphosphatase [Burkholderiales bacterium]
MTYVAKKFKIPVSVLVVVHTPDLQVLLIERVDRPGFWQSVTGSQEQGETLRQTALRELAEETGLDAQAGVLTDWNMRNEFEIYPEWRWRYAPGVTRNIEHVFGLCVPKPVPATLSPREHLAYAWLPHDRAAEKVFSWSNARVLRSLPEFVRSAA